MKVLSTLIGLAASVLAFSTQAVVWDMPTPHGDDNFHTVNIQRFAEDVEAATGGKLKIKVHSEGRLYPHPEIRDAVRSGKVAIGEFKLSRLGREDALFEVDAVPFLASTYEKADFLWQASRPAIASLLEKQGLMVLFAVPWPPEGMYSKKPLNRIEDLEGLRVYAYDNSTALLARYAGAIPTRVESPEVPKAFGSGQVQAMIDSPSTGAEAKAWNFVEYFYHTQAWLPKNVVVVNRRAFLRLDLDVRSAVLAAAGRAQRRGWEASRAETSHRLDVLREHGMSVHRPENGLMQGLYKIGRKLAHDWTERAGDDGIRIIQRYYSLH